MSDQTVKLIKLIKEGKTCNDICGILGISNKQLFNNLTNLRNKGFFLKRKYQIFFPHLTYYSPTTTSVKPIT